MRRVLTSLLLLLTGCLNCTEIGCEDTLTYAVTMQHSGAWELVLETDDAVFECEVQLAEEGGVTIPCDDEGTVVLLIDELATGFAGTVTLFGLSPEVITLTAFANGELVFEQTDVPEYTALYPNGRLCDFDNPCQVAEIAVDLE